MINITEEQLKEIVTQAHMAGQHNQAHCDPSYFEAETHWQKQVKNLAIPVVSQQRELLITAFTEADRTGYIELLTNAETIADKVISGNL